MPALLNYAFALMFLSAALHKIGNLSEFREILRGYDILPAHSIEAMRLLIPLIELVVALALVFNIGPARGAAVLLILLYAGVMLISVLRGRTHIDCGCSWGSTNIDNGTGLSWKHVCRNVVLVILAGIWLLELSGRPLTFFDRINGFLFVCASYLFGIILLQLRRNNWLARRGALS